MTAAPQGTLIQIFVELSKWGVGEPPSWSVSRQVSCRWLVTAGPHAGLRESPQRGFGLLTVLWVVLAKRKTMEEDGAVVQVQHTGLWCLGWWRLGCLCRAGSSVGRWGSAHSSRLCIAPALSCRDRDRDLAGNSPALVRLPPVRGEQGMCGFA